MIEQLSLFGERDPATAVAAWLEECAEKQKRFYDWVTLPSYVLDMFSHYTGGTASYSLAEDYWSYDFSPKGCRLLKRGTGEEVFVKKSAILRLLGIKDDHKDVMRGESYEAEVC